jgi:hypothetical protein
MMRTGKSHAGRVNLTKYVKMRGTASETWRGLVGGDQQSDRFVSDQDSEMP